MFMEAEHHRIFETGHSVETPRAGLCIRIIQRMFAASTPDLLL